MAPPAVAIVLGVTAVVSITVAFHQFVYEPHLAPRVEVAITNWLDRRRQLRREAAAYRAVPDDDDGDLQDETSEIVPPVEMDTIVKEEPGWRSGPPLTLNEAGTSELRKRNTSNHILKEEESVWSARSTAYEPLEPVLVAPRAQSPPTRAPSTTTISHTSTPSTVESSLLNFTSPSDPLMVLSPAQNVSLRTRSPDSTASQPDPLADSILSNTVHQSLFSAHVSPIQSPIRISPRGLQVNFAPISPMGEDEVDTHLLSQAHEPVAQRSPLASTIYESFTGTQDTASPSLPLSATPRTPPRQHTIFSPFSDSLSLVEHPTAPASTASWSDIGSAGAEGDRDELFLGSDAETWASTRDTRRT